MNPERWKQIEEIFYAAVELPEQDRESFLRKTCEQDAELQNEVKSLLQRDIETGTILKTVISKAAESLTNGESPDLIGKRIGPYRIIGLIGQGGMAQVYKAVRDDDQYQKVVAIKMIRLDLAPTFLISRFWYERQILANLEHPCIARFLEGGTTEERVPYFVMEYIEGEPITTYCDRHGLTIEKRLELFLSVCDAVQYAHRNLVVHRDLKPRNILVTSEGVPKLLDFGIAKLVNPELTSDVPGSTVTSVRLMTPEYASPEQVRGEKVTTSTDVYSLGLVLYELLSGVRPQQFKTNSFSEIERVVCEQEPERPSSAVMRSLSDTAERGMGKGDRKKWSREFARELDNIVFMAMQKDPQRRYPTVEQFADDIQRYRSGLPIRARAQTLGYRALKFARRHRTGVAVVAFLAFLLSGFAAVMTFQASRIAKERDRANQVTEFLVKIFEVSNPGESKGNSVTARELLDSSAQKIQADLQKQPEAQAAMMDTMGQVYGNLGLYNTAIPLLEKALQIRKQTLGERNPDIASTMNHLAEALQNAGKHDAALRMANEALTMRRKLLGNEHPDVASSLGTLGGSLYETGKYAEAEAAFRESLAIREKAFGEEHVKVATSLSQLAMIVATEGKKDEAEPLNRRALAIRRKLLGNDHPDVAASLNNLGRALMDKGDYDGAEQMFREAVELDRKILGKDHPDLAVTLSSLGYSLKEKKENVEAEKLFREALALRRKALGNEHPAIARSLCTIGPILIERGDYAGAESIFREAQQVWMKSFPPNHVEQAHVFSGLGRVRMGQGNHKEAEEFFRQALEIRLRGYPADHPNIAAVKGYFGECLIHLHRYQEAESMLLDSYRIYSLKRGVNHPISIEAAARLESLYVAWGKPAEAARYKSP